MVGAAVFEARYPQVALFIAKSLSIKCRLILKQTIDYIMENGELARSPNGSVKDTASRSEFAAEAGSQLQHGGDDERRRF